jgi:adenine deaminase
MSDQPYERVHQDLVDLHAITDACGAIKDPFMYLSFLALTVIPEIRITTQGVFDVKTFSHVPLFVEE